MLPVVNEWMEQVVMEDDWWEALLTNREYMELSVMKVVFFLVDITVTVNLRS